MPPPFAANWNEKVLIQVSCMRRQGPLAYNGLLTLTDLRLNFVPTGRLDRMVGVAELELPTRLIESAELKGLDKDLVITFDEDSVLFAGRGAQQVFARLNALLNEKSGGEAQSAFEPGERVLVQGLATSYANGVIATRGEVVLTDKRLRFLPGGGLETLIWTFPELDHPLEAITRAEMSGVRKLIEIWVDGERRIFGGPVVLKLFNSLQAIGIKVGPDGDAFHKPDGVFRSFAASAYRGPLAHPGEVIISETHVSFTPSGRLDSLVGARACIIPLVDLMHLEVLKNNRLILVGRKDSLAIKISKPLTRLQELLPLTANALSAALDNIHEESQSKGSPDNFDDLLQDWLPQLNLRLGEPIVLTGPALHWVRPQAGTRGWLALTDARLLFLPSTGPEGNSKPVIMDLTDLNRGESLNPDDIFIETDDSHLHFKPLTGAGFTDAFWMLSEPIITDEIDKDDLIQREKGAERKAVATKQSPVTIDPSIESRSDDHALQRGIGTLLNLSIQREEKTILVLSPAFTIRTKEGMGILLTQAPGLRFRRGELIEVEFAQPEGTYQFDTLVHRMAPVPSHIAQTYPDAMGLLVVEMPTGFRFHNRRQNYRIEPPSSCSVDVLFLEEIPGLADDQIAGTLSNLSMSGCQITSRDFIPEGAKAVLKIEINDNLVEIQSVCLRNDPPEDIRGEWMYGFRFVHLSDNARKTINQEIVRLQREELARKALEQQN
jgi:c-di-GMP-binding flagellar brake protein YcgR